MTEYVASQMMRNFVTMLREGVRDLANPDLSPYYAGPTIPASAVPAALAVVQAGLSAAGLGALPESDFISQAGTPSSAVLLTVAVGMGVEDTFTDDLYEDVPVVRLPDLGFRTSFASERMYDQDAVAGLRTRAGVVPSAVQHIKFQAPPLLADTDPYARVKIRRAKEYVRRYLSVS
jgi:hypothetical protein